MPKPHIGFKIVTDLQQQKDYQAERKERREANKELYGACWGSLQIAPSDADKVVQARSTLYQGKCNSPRNQQVVD